MEFLLIKQFFIKIIQKYLTHFSPEIYFKLQTSNEVNTELQLGNFQNELVNYLR